MNHLLKKTLALAACLSLFLSGCADAQTQTVQPIEDSETISFENVAVIGRPEGFALYENKDGLSLSGYYYASWVQGQPTEYVNEEDETVDLYPAQIYVLVQQFEDAQTAEDELNRWKETAKSTYSSVNTQPFSAADFSGELLSYDIEKTQNPYCAGMSAFGLHQNAAIAAEALWTSAEDAVSLQTMQNFLDTFDFEPSGS